jgi:hypothetical protein
MGDFLLSKSFCPPSFPCPLAVLRLSFFESTMGLGEATCVYAVFMPTSFRILRVSGKINQTNRKAFYPEAGAAPAIHPTASCEIAGSFIYTHY